MNQTNEAAQGAAAGRNLRQELIDAGALRQYCHNDGSAGFVTAYDFDVTNRFLAALKNQPAPTEAAQGEESARLEWQRITAPGQVKVGDKLRFTIGDEKFSERVKQIINPGYPDEELIYNKRRNFYVITSNAITNFGSSKNVEYLVAPQPQEKPGMKESAP